MTAIRTISVAAATAALAVTGVAGAAEAPVVSKQQFIAGAAPLTIPGTGIQQGEWMGSKARLLYRDVTVEGRQRATVILRAPKGLRIRGLAIQGGPTSQLGFVAVTKSYPGKRQVVVRAWSRDRDEATGRIYALAK
jgi:hypothetical protein